MEYTVVFSTLNKYKFYLVVDCFEKHNVKYQKHDEYRLLAEFDYGVSSEPATIRVPKNDLAIAEELIENCELWDDFSYQTNGAELFYDKSKLDEDLYEREIQAICGCEIKEVYYVVSEGVEYDFESIHFVDDGLVIVFSNGHYLSWFYKEEEVDFENDIYIPPFFDLKFGTHFTYIDKPVRDTKILTNNEYWKHIRQEAITGIKIYTQMFEDKKIVTDVIIEMRSKKVAIYSVNDEPTDTENEVIFDISMGNKWTVVVFDEDIIKASDRIE